MRNRNRSLCAERIKTWAVSWLGLCTPIGLWNDLHLHKVHAQTHRRARTRRATCRPTAQIHSTVKTGRREKKDYYIKPKSTQREKHSWSKMERARGEAWRLLFLINRGEVQGLRRAGRSQGKISALLHDDPPRLHLLRGSVHCRYFSEFPCLTAACLLFPPNPIPPPRPCISSPLLCQT